MASAKKHNGIVVSELELADYLGLTDRRVRQMAQEGLVVKVSKGKYDLKESVQRYIASIKSKETPQTQSLEKLKVAKEYEVMTHEKLKKRKTELIVEQMEKKLHSAEDVESVWNTMIFSAKSKLTAIPTKIAPMIVGIEDTKEVQAILKREINDCLNDISKYDVNDFDKEFEDEIYGSIGNEE